MDSLEKICLYNVARDADLYQTSDFAGLPFPLIRQLPLYLSPYQLNRLHCIFQKEAIDVQKIWKKHLDFHCNKSFDRSATIFQHDDVSGEDEVDARRLYLERLFQKMLGNLDLDQSHYAKMNRMHQCLHGCTFHCVDSTPLNKFVLSQELLKYAEHVRVLKVAATVPMMDYLLAHNDLLGILQSSLRRLDIYYVGRRDFSACVEVVRRLVQEGNVSEVALFKTHLSPLMMKELLCLVSGQFRFLSGSGSTQQVACDPDGGRMDLVVSDTELNQRLLSDDEEAEAEIYEDSNSVSDGVDLTFNSLTESNKSLSHECSIATYTEDLYDAALTSLKFAGYDRSSNKSSIVYEYVTSLGCENGTGIGCKPGSKGTESRRSAHDCSADVNCHSVSSCNFASVCDDNRTASHVHELGRSCTSLTMGYQQSCDQMENVIGEVLKNWSSLKKLAIFEMKDICESDSKRKERSVLIENFVHQAIQNNNLTHLMFYATDMCPNIFSCVLNALASKQHNDPLQEIALSVVGEQTISLPLDVFKGLGETEFRGTVCLDLCSCCFGSDTSRYISTWIRIDCALRHLHLSNFNNPSFLVEILDAVQCNQKIETLDLCENTFNPTSDTRLLSIFQSVHSLQSVNLSDCSLSKELVGSESFLTAICGHPSLTRLNLGNNQLEEVGCSLLKAICLQRKSIPFQSLNLSCNRIMGQLLLSTVDEIKAAYKRMQWTLWPVLQLVLSGNHFMGLRHALVQSIGTCVESLIVHDLEFADPSEVFADHVSQM